MQKTQINENEIVVSINRDGIKISLLTAEKEEYFEHWKRMSAGNDMYCFIRETKSIYDQVIENGKDVGRATLDCIVNLDIENIYKTKGL